MMQALSRIAWALAVALVFAFGMSVSWNSRAEILLDQGWDEKERETFYFDPQGAKIVPYDWFLVLETPEGEELFRTDRHMASFGYLPSLGSDLNPDGLPVGFTKDEQEDGSRWLGMNCAACHVNNIDYKGATIRVDGAPTLANFYGFVDSLTASLKATLEDGTRFRRFEQRLARLVGKRKEREALADLRDRLQGQVDTRVLWAWRNHAPTPAGHGRVDALTIIINQIAARDLGIPGNQMDAAAPVSYPFLWDTPYHDFVQWNGAAPNAHLGSLGRNVGQVLGVFGSIDLHKAKGLVQMSYESSVLVKDLYELEASLRTLTSPLWPETILPPIDRTRAERGRILYAESCAGCHRLLTGDERSNPKRKIKAIMIGVEKLGTDPLTATLFANRKVKTGQLAGEKNIPIFGKPLPEEVPAAELLANAVFGTIVHEWKAAPVDELKNLLAAGPVRPGNLLAYKARPLNGIWATAPYLHNGSVPTLYDLLLPPGERPKHFHVGSRVFDPEKVGFQTQAGPGTSLLDTGRRGNSNAGHKYGTNLDEDGRRDLVEYLKTL
jgi:hypothetical protein